MSPTSLHVGDAATIVIDAVDNDPNGALTYVITVTRDGILMNTFSSSSATFWATVEGEYNVECVAVDSAGHASDPVRAQFSVNDANSPIVLLLAPLVLVAAARLC